MSVGRESIRRAANAGAGKTVKKPLYLQKRQRNRKQYLLQKKRKKQQRVLFILMKNCRYIFFKSYL